MIQAPPRSSTRVAPAAMTRPPATGKTRGEFPFRRPARTGRRRPPPLRASYSALSRADPRRAQVDARDPIISWSQPTTHATSSIEPASRTLPRRLLEPQLRRRSLRQAAAEGCPDLASGDLKFSVTTWSSLPSEDLVRVGAVDAAITGGAAAAREMYVSLVVTHKRRTRR